MTQHIHIEAFLTDKNDLSFFHIQISFTERMARKSVCERCGKGGGGGRQNKFV